MGSAVSLTQKSEKPERQEVEGPIRCFSLRLVPSLFRDDVWQIALVCRPLLRLTELNPTL